MPIAIQLLLCVPIGLVAYFEARWLIRHFFGHFESRERKAALICGFFGVSLIPLLHCFGYIEREYPGRLGENLAMGFLFIAFWAFAGPVVAILSKGK
jgi:hypothetical protein